METKIYINNEEIELIEEVAIPITYSIADIRDPDKRDTAYSKTVTLPGTQFNNKLFGHIWNVNSSINSSGTTNFNPNFNPNLKASVIITYKGVVQFTGVAQMLAISVNDNYEIEYEFYFLGELGNVIQITDNKTVDELDLSEYDHTYTLQNIINSWSYGINRNGSFYPFTLGVGYVYPMIDYGYNDTTVWKVNHFFPGVYLKTITDRIFSEAGFQVSSDFFDSERYKRLIIPYSGGSLLKLTDTQIAQRTFRAASSGVTTFSKNGTAVDSQFEIGDETTAPSFDDGGVYNNSTYTFTAAKTGTYIITLRPKCSVTHFPSSASTSLNGTTRGLGWFQVKKNGSVLQSVFTGVSNPGVYVPGAFYIPTQSITITSGDTTLEATGDLTFTVALNAGETITTTFKTSVSGSTYTTGSDSASNYARLNIRPGTVFLVKVADPTLQEGDTVSINSVLPQKIKQSDLLKSLIKAFNLIVRPDTVTPNKLYIEPDPDFFDLSDPEDWSNKLDELKDFVITPMGELNTKRYTYSYKSDSDFYNKDYEGKYSEVYGTKIVDVENDFLQNEIKTELIFSPTPLVDNLGHDRIISKIIDIDDQGNIKPKPSNVRLLYYGGLVSTNQPYEVSASSGSTFLSSYAYAGHLDSTSSPTFDLCFGSPKEVMYLADYYTANNLYNLYYKQKIDQISDKNSKLVTAFFHLNEIDIGKLNFAKSYYFKNEVWRLNKILDYNPSSVETVKCEFIKLKEVAPFVTLTPTPVKGGVKFEGADPMPGYMNRTIQNNSYGIRSNGEYNQLPSIGNGIIVSGSNNVVGEGSTNVTILGSSGVVVLGGLENVTLINSNNITVTESNTSYVNGTQVSTSVPKKYNALLTQSGTNAPTATILENTLSGTPTFIRNSAGNYSLNLNGEFANNKTVIVISNNDNNGAGGSGSFIQYQASWQSVDYINFISQSVDIPGGTCTSQDGLITYMPLLIMVYP